MKEVIKKLYANYQSQNTPELAHKVGNWLLSLGAIGVTIVGLPAIMETSGITGFVVPAFALKIAKGLIAAGVFGKVITKLFGQQDAK